MMHQPPKDLPPLPIEAVDSTEDVIRLLRWYEEQVESLYRHMAAKPPRFTATEAIIMALSLDAGRRATAAITYLRNPGTSDWQLEALRQTVALAVEFRWETEVTWRSVAHLQDMLRRAELNSMSPGKLGRWLGWAQATVAMHSPNPAYTSLDFYKRLNKDCKSGVIPPWSR